MEMLFPVLPLLPPLSSPLYFLYVFSTQNLLFFPPKNPEN